MSTNRRAIIILAAWIAVTLGILWGGAVPAAYAQTIQVTAADPPSGEQGTLNLNVIIKGKGFKNGAKAKFYRTGTVDPDGINVKSTQYVSSTQLLANIDIADWATLALYDIEVRNADGRTGKGTELFSVTEKKIDPCSLPDPIPTPSAYITDVPGNPGYLDATFGNGTGRVIGPRHMKIGSYVMGSPMLAIQNVAGEARIVAVGTSNNACVNNSQTVWAVARYLPDGTLDPSFGSGGIATVEFYLTTGWIAVVVQPVDNKIVVVGGARASNRINTLPVAVRLNPDGSLDSSFGNGGKAWIPLPGGKSAGGHLNAVAIQSDGMIVAAGVALAIPYIVRLNPNGTVDTSFNADPGPDASFLTSLRIQRFGSEERIVVAGATHGYYGAGMATVWRFTSSGSPDTSFGGTGMVVTSFHAPDAHYVEDMFNDLAIDSSNRIVAAGYALDHPYYPDLTSESQLALARYDEYGNLDPMFGIGGKVMAPSGQDYGIGNATAIQADGHILVAGYSHDNAADGNPVNYMLGVWRFNADGTADTVFGNGGWVPDPITEGKRLGYWTGMVLQSDGKIVCGGYVLMESDPLIYYAVIARFWQ
jgi:uncharacterized delta-60 repeat protein